MVNTAPPAVTIMSAWFIRVRVEEGAGEGCGIGGR